MIRTFVGCFLPDLIGRHIENHRKTEGETASFRWTPLESLHITLKFMGNVDAQRMEGISALLRSVAARHRPVQLNLEGGGVFPSKKSARVLWAGIAGDVFTLSRLANDVESSMESLGFPQENRKFKPHVTLAKPRGERSSSDDSERFCKLFATYFSPMFELNSLQLIQSQLTPSGSRYSTLDSFPLGNPI